MMNDPNDMEIIGRFFKKELSEEELSEFNERISRDGAFAREVAEQIALKESLKKKRRKEISRILDQKAAAARPGRRKRVLYIAASLFLIIAILCVSQFFKKPRLTEGERTQAIAELEADPALSVAGPGWRKLIKSDPDSALILLDRLIVGSTDPCEDPELNYFAGMLQLYYKQEYQIAETYLSCVLGETAERSFRPDVPRQLAVAKALSGKGREAKGLIARYQIPAGALPETIRRYLELDAER